MTVPITPEINRTTHEQILKDTESDPEVRATYLGAVAAVEVALKELVAATSPEVAMKILALISTVTEGKMLSMSIGLSKQMEELFEKLGG